MPSLPSTSRSSGAFRQRALESAPRARLPSWIILINHPTACQAIVDASSRVFEHYTTKVRPAGTRLLTRSAATQTLGVSKQSLRVFYYPKPSGIQLTVSRRFAANLRPLRRSRKKALENLRQVR